MPTPLPPPPTLFLLLLLLSLSRLLLCHAQDDSTPDKSPPVPYSTSFNPSIAIIIVILISAFFFLGFFSIYLRQCGNSEDATAQGRTFPLARSRRGARGLDPSVIESFPTLVYSDVKEHKIGKGALECSVCLSEFDDEETLRLLPRCDHVFHPECIDMWLSSHTTCPVCRANLAAVDDPQSASPTPPPVADPVSPSPAPTTPPAADVIVDVDNEHDHVTIPVAEQDATAATTETTTEGERKPEVAPDLGRIESKKAGSLLLPWRSRSARPTMTQNWTEEDRERFTLRLPEYMRREVLAGKLNRSLTVTAFRGGEGSSRRRYRGEGSSRGGRSFKLGGRSDRMAKSDRWAFFSRPLSFKLTRSGGDGESSSIKRGEGSTRKVRDGDGEGSSKGKVFARGPLDCLGGGGGGSVKDGDGNGEEGSTVVLPKV